MKYCVNAQNCLPPATNCRVGNGKNVFHQYARQTFDMDNFRKSVHRTQQVVMFKMLE
jgi:hypothetical protein